MDASGAQQKLAADGAAFNCCCQAERGPQYSTRSLMASKSLAAPVHGLGEARTSLQVRGFAFLSEWRCASTTLDLANEIGEVVDVSVRPVWLIRRALHRHRHVVEQGRSSRIRKRLCARRCCNEGQRTHHEQDFGSDHDRLPLGTHYAPRMSI